MNNLPTDIQHKWYSVTRRMQSVSRTNGLAIISISVLVDQEGAPLAWTEPKCTKIEPKRSANELIEMLFDNRNI